MGIKASVHSGSATSRVTADPASPEDDTGEDLKAQWLTQFCGVPKRR